MTTHTSYPWFFRRTEVDLLEEDVDRLYETYGSSDGRMETMEQFFLQEQCDTEEEAEADFTLDTDVTWFVQNALREPLPSSMFFLESENKEDLSPDVERPKLYQEAFTFAKTVFAYATSHETRTNLDDRASLFRIRVNINMIPIKIANAISAEWHEDALSMQFAKKEYLLAFTYLERVMMTLMDLAENQDREAHAFLKEGMRLLKSFRSALDRFRKKK